MLLVEMIRYSIIIPHKDTPLLLQRCLDSIPIQEEIQVIIVDDNSDRSKVDFSKFPGLGRLYTEVYFMKEGKGAGYARNIGLQRVKGEWVLFADADDFFTKDLPQLLTQYKDTNYDIIFFLTYSVYSDDLFRKASRDHNNKYIQNYLREPSSITESQLRYGFIEPWGKMIRTDLILNNHIFFEESVIVNDYRFSLSIGHAAKNILAVNKTIYTVTHSNNSLTYQKGTYLQTKSRIMTFNNAFHFFKKNNLPLIRDHLSITMPQVLKNNPIWFIRISFALLKQNPRNICNIIYSFHLIPAKIKNKLKEKIMAF